MRKDLDKRATENIESGKDNNVDKQNSTEFQWKCSFSQGEQGRLHDRGDS